MKVLHIKAEANVDILPVVKKAQGMLGKEVGIVTTVQHLHNISKAVAYLKSKGIKAKSYGQILGCKIPEIREKTILYIGDGMFHPKGILLKLKESEDKNGGKKAKRVISANPFTMEIRQITKKDIEDIQKKTKGALLKFYSSANIGVLISSKHGQMEVQAKLKEIYNIGKIFKDKSFYYFICDTLDFNELENFPFIECWINAMCPRIAQDDAKRAGRPIININDILQNNIYYKKFNIYYKKL